MTLTGELMVKLAEDSYSYLTKITEKFASKVSIYGGDQGKYKLLLIDPKLQYNHEAIEIVKRIYKRSNFDLALKKYRITTKNKYAYIFELDTHTKVADEVAS